MLGDATATVGRPCRGQSNNQSIHQSVCVMMFPYIIQIVLYTARRVFGNTLALNEWLVKPTLTSDACDATRRGVVSATSVSLGVITLSLNYLSKVNVHQNRNEDKDEDEEYVGATMTEDQFVSAC
ncbi:hypothetical protein J6590_003528 [Homalodisca vitripennis]|nr:hypothetical protein J6590_003528 [Homalodisca vitripennis]